MCSKRLDDLFIDGRQAQAPSLQPLAEMDRRVQVAADGQRRVADRRHFSGETFKITSGIPDIDVMGARKKLSNVSMSMWSFLVAGVGGQEGAYVMCSSPG